MLNSETPARTLSSLTPEECQTLFALAFGYAPPLEQMRIENQALPFATGFQVASHTRSLILYSDGQAHAFDAFGHGTIFNFRKVAGYLDSLNIDFKQP